MQVLAERGYLQMLLHAHLARQTWIISSADSQTTSQPWAVYLLDNAVLVPTPLYYMSSLDSSIDR
jgi:hypothetical protein